MGGQKTFSYMNHRRVTQLLGTQSTKGEEYLGYVKIPGGVVLCGQGQSMQPNIQLFVFISQKDK